MADRWLDPSLCDICGGKCDNMTGENGHAGPVDFVITYCMHHTEDEIYALYNKIYEQGTFNCDNCGKRISKLSSLCGYCDHVYSTLEIFKCICCDKWISKGVIKCHRCGHIYEEVLKARIEAGDYTPMPNMWKRTISSIKRWFSWLKNQIQ